MIYHEFAIGAETLPETIESGPLCITDLFQNKNSPKKTGFSPEKNTSPPKKKFLTFFLRNFSVRTLFFFFLTTKS